MVQAVLLNQCIPSFKDNPENIHKKTLFVFVLSQMFFIFILLCTKPKYGLLGSRPDI